MTRNERTEACAMKTQLQTVLTGIEYKLKYEQSESAIRVLRELYQSIGTIYCRVLTLLRKENEDGQE